MILNLFENKKNVNFTAKLLLSLTIIRKGKLRVKRL